MANKWHTIENVSREPGGAAELQARFEDLPLAVVEWDAPLARTGAASFTTSPGFRSAEACGSGGGVAPSVAEVKRKVYANEKYVYTFDVVWG